MERMLVEGLLSKERELAREQQSLKGDYRWLFSQIEERLDLKEGSIPSRYSIDPSNWSLVSADESSNGQRLGDSIEAAPQA